MLVGGKHTFLIYVVNLHLLIPHIVYVNFVTLKLNAPKRIKMSEKIYPSQCQFPWPLVPMYPHRCF